jgi:uncharacterized protein (DUF305 family)
MESAVPTPVRDRRLRATIVAVAASTVLAACGGDPSSDAQAPVPSHGGVPSSLPAPSATPTPTVPAPTIPPATGPHNELDVMFATDMIPHHRQAVEMAEMAQTRAKDPRIKDLARRIGQAQQAEVKLMSSWLRRWKQPVPPPDQMHTSHGPGMMTHAEMEDLKAAKGTAFDRMFCDMMIRHHDGALQMATITQENGKNRAVIALAKLVVDTQTAEVDELRSIQDSL